jgi:archaellum component FlaF (FlaF/FlaG flagellin family)
VANDTNSESDVFVYDRQSSSTTRVSVGAGGAQANDGSAGRISGDGRFIVFSSYATNLVPGDTNGTGDVFVRDRQTSTTTRVSIGAGGAQANGASSGVDISADGRFVAFSSHATNLVSGDTNGVADVFVRDRTGSLTTRMSTGQFLAQGDNESGSITGTLVAPAISGDGRYVAMWTYATNLVTPDDNGTLDVVVHANPVPTVTSASPTSVARGSSVTITVNGTSFLPGVQALFGDGITLTAVNRVSDTQVKFSISVAAGAATGSRTVLVYVPGTGPGLLTGAAGQLILNIT